MQRTRNVSLFVCLWPGLARLWFLGQWSGLLVAIVFALMLNCALLCSFVWPAIVESKVCLLIWAATVIGWSFASWRTFQRRDDLLDVQFIESTDHDPLLCEAQLEYLQRRFAESAALLERILFSNPRDVEARLFLATSYRRQRLWGEARDQLRMIQRYDQAIKWQNEIEIELEGIERDELEDEQNPELTANLDLPGIPENDNLETINMTPTLADQPRIEENSSAWLQTGLSRANQSVQDESQGKRAA